MSSKPERRGIPADFGGVRFRSRLECRYAILWDLLGIQWEYEPDLSLDGYIPDFVLDAELYGSPTGSGPLLVEVRPVIDPEGFREPIAKIARSGWTGAAMVVGATLFARETPWGRETSMGRAHPFVLPRHADDDVAEWYRAGWYPSAGVFGMGGEDITAAWREAGARNQWMPRR